MNLKIILFFVTTVTFKCARTSNVPNEGIRVSTSFSSVCFLHVVQQIKYKLQIFKIQFIGRLHI